MSLGVSSNFARVFMLDSSVVLTVETARSSEEIEVTQIVREQYSVHVQIFVFLFSCQRDKQKSG